MRHLQEASSSDGKGENPDQNASSVVVCCVFTDVLSYVFSAAMNLEKLKLFRHYYVMVRRVYFISFFSAAAALHSPLCLIAGEIVMFLV